MNQPIATTRFSRRAVRSASRTGRGYTLIELLVVITIIVLLAGVALPGIVGLFSAGAESTAYNMLAAQITAARACAIQNGTFAALHIQMSIKNDPKINPGCYVAVMLYDRVTGTFGLAPGYTPRRMPGSIAFGEISVGTGTDFFVDENDPPAYQNLTDADLDDFREMTIVFTPTGSIVNSIGGGGIAFDPNDPLFVGTLTAPALWDDPATINPLPAAEPGVSAVVMFDNTVLEKAAEADRYDLLERIGRLAPINVYTGQLFDR